MHFLTIIIIESAVWEVVSLDEDMKGVNAHRPQGARGLIKETKV